MASRIQVSKRDKNGRVTFLGTKNGKPKKIHFYTRDGEVTKERKSFWSLRKERKETGKHRHTDASISKTSSQETPDAEKIVISSGIPIFWSGRNRKYARCDVSDVAKVILQNCEELNKLRDDYWALYRKKHPERHCHKHGWALQFCGSCMEEKEKEINKLEKILDNAHVIWRPEDVDRFLKNLSKPNKKRDALIRCAMAIKWKEIKKGTWVTRIKHK